MEVRYLPSGGRGGATASGWAGIKFLNAYPLLRNLEDDLQGWSRAIASPSECASLLDAGKVELAQTPLITAVINNWPFLGEIGIACNGPVTSVKLIHHKELRDLKTYRPDPASGTSNVLARLWYNLEYGRDLVPDMRSEDAEIVIGDRAFEADTADQVDLGAAWHRETGLPFVFGVWAARDEKLLSQLAPALIARLERNLADREYLVSDASRLTGKLINVREYLYKSLHYQLTERDHLGLHTFIDLAHKYELIPTRNMRMILAQPTPTAL